MSKLGSNLNPAVVKVQTEMRAMEIMDICEKKGWKVIVGIEPNEEENINDVERLLNPPNPVFSQKINRNDPCPCGSGKKYKKCCINI